jgi:hypothetical protein
MDAKFVVNLSGRDYPLFAGILAEAHERGLQAIETELIQIPAEGNDYVAIVKATVRMKDGTVFQDYGDASPRNCSAKIASALIRMASTRSKGRALRDAINVGQTMLEELPDLDDAGAGQAAGNGRPAPQAQQAARTVAAAEKERVSDRVSQPGEVSPPGGYFTDDKGKIWELAQLKEAARACVRRAQALGIPLPTFDPLTAEPRALYDFGREMGPLIRAREAELKAERTAAKG